MTRKFIFIISLLMLAKTAKSEDLFLVVFDKPFYVAGENIRYHLSITNSKTVTIFYQINGAGGDLVHSGNILLENGHGQGMFNVGEEISSGLYSFSFFAFDLELGNFRKIATYYAPVYSINEIGDKALFIDSKPLLVDTTYTAIKFTKESFRPNDTITFEWQAADIVSATMSVLNRGSVLGIVSHSLTARAPKFIDGDQIYITGKLVNENLERVINKQFSFFSEKTYKSFPVRTNQTGEFVLELEASEAGANFQIIDLPQSSKIISCIDSALVTGRIPEKWMNEPSNQLKEYFNLYKKRIVVSHLFNSDQNSIETKGNDIQSYVPDQLIEPKKYTAFKSFEEFLKEAGTPIKVKREKETAYLRMFNSQDRIIYSGQPLVVVDGVRISDINFLLKIRLSDIEKIEIYNRTNTLRKYFGNSAPNGVIVISSYLLNVIPSELSKRLTINGHETVPIEQLPSEVKRLEPLVNWSPNLKLRESSRSVSFPHNQLTGEFQVDLVGIGKNGDIMKFRGFYVVK